MHSVVAYSTFFTCLQSALPVDPTALDCAEQTDWDCIDNEGHEIQCKYSCHSAEDVDTSGSLARLTS